MALSAALSCEAAPARAADEGIEPIRVHVTAHPGCPGEMSFTEQIRARTLKARPAADGEIARSFTVIVVLDGSMSRGRLLIDDPRDPSASAVRAVSGRTCAEVVSAMALISALAIDPEQAYPARPPGDPRGAPETPVAALPGAPPAVVSAQPALYYERPPSTSLDPRRGSPYLAPVDAWDPLAMPLPALLSAASGDGAAIGWRFAAGVGGAALGAASPVLLPALSVFIEIQHVADGLFSPSLRFSLTRAQGSALDTGAGIARFALTEGRIEGCPLDVPLAGGRRLGASPCVTFETGALEASGEGFLSSQSHMRPWVALGALGRLHLAIGDVVRVEVEAGAIVPFVRDTFYFAPENEVHDVPAVGGFAGGGVGVYFP